jgi:LacI family transcriptional regulator
MGERAMALALGDDPGPRAEPAEATIVWRESCAPPVTR